MLELDADMKPAHSGELNSVRPSFQKILNHVEAAQISPNHVPEICQTPKFPESFQDPRPPEKPRTPLSQLPLVLLLRSEVLRLCLPHLQAFWVLCRRSGRFGGVEVEGFRVQVQGSLSRLGRKGLLLAQNTNSSTSHNLPKIPKPMDLTSCKHLVVGAVPGLRGLTLLRGKLRRRSGVALNLLLKCRSPNEPT